MALLPYSVRQVTHRNKGKGRGDREGGRDGRDGRDGDSVPESAGAEDLANEELLEETEGRDDVVELEGAEEAAGNDEESS
jgi:hypothetical protein